MQMQKPRSYDAGDRSEGYERQAVLTTATSSPFRSAKLSAPWISRVADAIVLNTSDPLAFVKEISSDGNVNTIDVIYPMAPMFYVLAPDYLRLLLEPVTRYLASGEMATRLRHPRSRCCISKCHRA